MKPAPFAYHRPHTLDEALALLDEHGGDAKPLAGGQSLIPAMNFRLATPAVLVDLNAVPDLQFIRPMGTGTSIGSMTRHRALEQSDVVLRTAPLAHAAMPFIAHPAIRTRGTVGGSLAHADPAAELPAVMVALAATLTLRRADATRRVAARDFFAGLFATAIEPGELLVEIEIPSAADHLRRGWAFTEFSRRHGDFALAGVAATVDLDEMGRCADASLALFGVGDRPMRADHACRTLIGEMPVAAVIRAAAEAAATSDIDPTSDIHASSRYRRHRVRAHASRARARLRARRAAEGVMMHVFDLSQPLNEQVTFWPYYPPFEVKYIKRKAEHGVNAQYIQTSNHMGTHLDAPRHFVTAGMTIDEIPMRWLCGPGVVVDLRDEMDELEIYTPKMIDDRVEVRKGDLLFLHTGWEKHAQFGAEPDEEKYIHRHPGAHPDMVPWLLEKEIHIWGVDCVSTDHPMNLPIGRFLGKGMHGHCDRVRAQCEAKFGGPEGVKRLFPDSAYQLTHNALFPKNCMHIENLGGEISAPELQNKRLILGCFPWKFKGGEAAFCRAVAFLGDSWKP